MTCLYCLIKNEERKSAKKDLPKKKTKNVELKNKEKQK